MRTLKTNCVYKHFKGNNYIVLGLISGDFDRSHSARFKGTAEETESGKIYHIYEDYNNNFMAIDSEGYLLEGKFVFYQALYDGEKCYLRELNMFMSKTNKIKYPKAEQEYRFECTEEEL